VVRSDVRLDVLDELVVGVAFDVDSTWAMNDHRLRLLVVEQGP